MTCKSVREMIEALISGERDPRVLAELARGRMRLKHAELSGPCRGRFDDHHGELAQMLLDRLDALTAAVDTLTARINVLPTSRRSAAAPTTARAPSVPMPSTRRSAQPGAWTRSRTWRDQRAEIIAEIGLDMGRFPTPGHLVSWAKLCPPTIQSGDKNTSGTTGKGNPYLRGALGEAAAGAATPRPFWAALPPPDQTPGKNQSPDRRRRSDPGRDLEPARQPRGGLPRTRPGLPHPTDRHQKKAATTYASSTRSASPSPSPQPA